jgi:hypothetical protein
MLVTSLDIRWQFAAFDADNQAIGIYPEMEEMFRSKIPAQTKCRDGPMSGRRLRYQAIVRVHWHHASWPAAVIFPS